MNGCRLRLAAIAATVLLLTCAGSPTAGDDAESSRRRQFESIRAEYDRTLADFRREAARAATPEDRDRTERLRPSLNAFGKRFLELAKERPADDVACDALVWIASNYGRREKMELDVALDLIEAHHLDSPKLKFTVDALAYSESPRARALVETIAEKSGDRDVRGFARFFTTYAHYMHHGASADLERRFERIRDEYADVKFENRTLGDMAEGHLFELRNLIVGKPALDMAGVDVRGAKLKLSDYRGKVVLLVFWGSWCGPCLGEIPHLQEIARNNANRPLVIVGVNSGDTKEQAAKTIAELNLSWPIFFDGEDGPIVRKWNVTSFPMIYMLDHGGTIRYKEAVEDPEVVLERLIREAERQ
jgi:thiol-disulfide isomerase/thioredoxin